MSSFPAWGNSWSIAWGGSWGPVNGASIDWLIRARGRGR